MKAKETIDLRQLPLEELKAQLKDCEEKYYHLKFKNKVAPAKNRMEIRTLRRDRARLLTWMREKTLRMESK